MKKVAFVLMVKYVVSVGFSEGKTVFVFCLY